MALPLIPPWPWTVVFWPQKLALHLCPIIHHWLKFGENLTNTFQDIVLISPESAVSSILYSTVTFTFYLFTLPFDPKLWHVHLCPTMHRWCKFGENVRDTVHDIVLTMFRHTHTEARMNRTNHYACGHTTLGGGTKITHSFTCHHCETSNLLLILSALSFRLTSPTYLEILEIRPRSPRQNQLELLLGFTSRTPFLSPNQQCKSTVRQSDIIYMVTHNYRHPGTKWQNFVTIVFFGIKILTTKREIMLHAMSLKVGSRTSMNCIRVSWQLGMNWISVLLIQQSGSGACIFVRVLKWKVDTEHKPVV